MVGMQATGSIPDRPLSLAILLWPGFPMMSLTGIVESLRHAGDHGDESTPRYARYAILGAADTLTRSSCGITVASTRPYPDPSEFDYVIVIGGLLPQLQQAPARHRAYLRTAFASGRSLVGVCTGSFVLVAEGALSRQPVCVHPYHQEHFETAWPDHPYVTDRDYLEAGQVTTVLGGVSILRWMQHIIGRHMGPDRAAKVEHQMTLPAPNPPSSIVPPSLADGETVTDSRVRRALVVLDAEAASNPPIGELARKLDLSERHFLRLFREQVGCSPQEYLLQTKLRAARWMLQNTTRSVTAIAYSAGFSSGANLAHHCRQRLGRSPGDLRRLPSGSERGVRSRRRQRF